MQENDDKEKAQEKPEGLHREEESKDKEVTKENEKGKLCWYFINNKCKFGT